MPRSLLLAVALCVFVSVLSLRTGHAAPTQTSQASGTSQLRAQLASLRASGNGKLPDGAWLSIEHALDVSERTAGSFQTQSKSWSARAQRWLKVASEGRDPLIEAKGEILMRGYRSAISEHLQGYAVYIPKDYDPARKYPVLVMLHGGSANGNLFLGVVLGNNMNWKEYSQHLWDDFTPRFTPQFIIVAPDGFGHVMWRWMGEQDVLDVIADVQKHYSVDENRIALGGLSNGGVGAYNFGLRHASRFSIVTPIAGAPSWLQYAGGSVPEAQRRAMVPLSGMQIAENAINTDLRYFHGHLDGGPMKPRFVEEFTKVIAALGVPFKEKWFDAGHDLLYLVHRHGKFYKDLEPLRRKQRPSEVRIVTGDYRANRQHWVTVTRIENYPTLARVRAVVNGDRIDLEAAHVARMELDLREVPLVAGTNLRIAVAGREIYSGPRAALGNTATIVHEGAAYRVQTTAPAASRALEKKPGLSGPITDSYYDAVLHVYGTQDPRATAALKRTAERSANGSPLWLWRVKQRVLADTEVSDALLHSHHVVLYATPGSNALLDRMLSALPMQLDAQGIHVGEQFYEGRGVGVKLIYPNPLAPERYVIVQAAPTTASVDGGRQLPDFLPDYVVYDAASTASRPRLTFPNKPAPRVMGYFDDAWQLPKPGSEHAALEAATPLADDVRDLRVDATSAPTIQIGVMAPMLTSRPALTASIASTTPLEAPPPPSEFVAAQDTQAGKAARAIAKRVQLFPSYRARIKHAIWTGNPLASWSIRNNDACMRVLAERGVQARVYAGALTTPVAAPVEITAPVDGLTLRMAHVRRTMLMSCELAARLPDLAALLKPHGVTAINVISAYRDHPFPSFHTLGLALDIARFETDRGPLNVRQDFEMTPTTPTCEGDPPVKDAAQRLRAIACSLAQSHRFSSVLTPNYNAGHRDHFHIDIRPDDPRLFVR